MSPRNNEAALTSTVPRQLGLLTATLVVVACMIGTGVFTTTGLLLAEMGSPGAVLLAWLLGGIIALCGALAYAELAASIARNGGEYRMLSDIAAGLFLYRAVKRGGPSTGPDTTPRSGGPSTIPGSSTTPQCRRRHRRTTIEGTRL